MQLWRPKYVHFSHYYFKWSKSPVMHCTIWYHLYNFKKVKNTHGGVLILVKFQASAMQPWPVESQSTHRKCKGEENGDDIKQIIIWLAKQGRKQITRKQITGTTTCSKSLANALGLSKQDNTIGTCAADLEQIIIWLANKTVNKIIEIMTCSKSTVNASGSY